MKKQFLKVDSRNRVCLTKILKDMPELFRVHVESNRVILEPVKEIPENERWLFEPENREILEQVKRGLKDTKTYSFDEVKKMLKK